MGADAIVIGAGVMGSAAAWRLASAGAKVLVCERFARGHLNGSSHGASRLFRFSYPDALYVQLAADALRGWRTLEGAVGQILLRTTGGIDFGDVDTLERTRDALSSVDVDSRWVDPSDARDLWPQIASSGPVLHQADTGILAASDAVRALQRAASASGCTIEFDTGVTAIESKGSGVEVVAGERRFSAETCVVTAGAWVPSLLADIVDLPPLGVTLEAPVIFEQADPSTPWPNALEYLPADTGEGTVGFYAVRSPGEGVKASFHGRGPVVDPDACSSPDPAYVERIVSHVEDSYPGLVPTPKSVSSCLYTTTATHDFLLDRVGPIIIGSPCSGHGFKFAPAIGDLLAELVMESASIPKRFSLAHHQDVSALERRERV